ncbi:MAG: hypothetical protein K1X50_06090 [Candidatus Promineofilum sp.]|nr:hypothetical protein [Promineifilum sp.]
MNTTIMAERQAKALQSIMAEVERLGGRFEQPTARVSGPQVKMMLLLEAVAAALAGIDAGGGVVESQVAEAPPAPAEVEPVEASSSVVKEPPAPKAKRGKE